MKIYHLRNINSNQTFKCVRGYVRESRLFVTMVLILIFAEVLGLYGLIVALILNAKADNGACSA